MLYQVVIKMLFQDVNLKFQDANLKLISVPNFIMQPCKNQNWNNFWIAFPNVYKVKKNVEIYLEIF